MEYLDCSGSSWKSKPMTRAEYLLAFLLGLVVLILVELIAHG